MINDGGTLHFRTSSKSYAVDHGLAIPPRMSSNIRAIDSEKAIVPQDAIQNPLSSQDRTLENDAEHVVDFDGADDPANPLNWSRIYKWGILALISVMSFVV